MNAIEMADNYKKKLEENKRNYIANIVSNDRRSLNDIVDSYITNFNGNRNSSYYKNEYKNEINKRNQLQKNIQKSTYEKGVQTTVTPFSTQRNILPIQEQSEITKSKKFEITAGQDKLKQNKDVEKKYQDIQQTDEYKKQMKELEEQSNKVGYAKYEYDKQRVAEDNIGWYDKSIGRLVDGFGNLFDYNGGLVKNENGDLMYLPTFNQMKNEKVRNEYDTAIGRFAGDILYESGKIAGSTLVNQVLPGVGSTMYFGKMFVDSTNQAISEGYDSGSATVYGLINVGLEYATGKMLGSATKGLTGGKTSSYEKLLNKTFSKVIKKPKIASILANAGSEATEEFIQEYLDNLTKLAVLEKSTDIKDYGSVFTNEDILADALYSAAIGSVTGGVIGTISGKDTNVDNNDVNLYDTFKKELEETKENTTNKDTINKIDTIISSIDSNINNDSNVNTIISQINDYETLKELNKITKEQEVELNNLKEKLNAIQNQNTDTSTSSKAEVNLPTVQDIVNQEKSSQNSVNLPVYNQQSNITNSDKTILPTVNDFNSSNINMPTSNIKVDMAKIKPEILEDIKGFKLGDPSIESYKGSYIKTMLNEVGIKVPNAMNYVSEVRPDMSFTTTKDLTRQQYSSISNALQKLRSIDVTSVNNANYSMPIGNYQYVKSSNANINELRRTASMYLNNTARSNNTIKLLENIIKDRNYIIRFNPNITNEQGVPVNGLITKENGKTIIELNPNADNYVEFLIVHEITHDIATKEMKELILDYAKQDPEFEKSLESLKERYKTNDVSDEVVADVCGELFGNREFIQSVVEKKPSIFEKILKNIRKLAEKIKGTGANEYVNFVENLKEMWEDAYYSNRSNLNETKFSIVYNNDGSFNRVKINQNIFENNGGKSISKTIHDYIKEHIGDIYTIIESGQKVYLGKDLPGEYAYSKSTQSLPISNKLAKGIAGYDLQEIIENVTNRKWEKSKHSSHNKDAKYGFYKYDTTFSFDYNGSEKIYTGVVLIRNDANGKKYLYDILNIKPQKKSVNLPSVASNSKMSSARFDGSSNQFTNNIPQSGNNVNSGTSSATKYSIPINKNNTQELNNGSFSLEKYKQKQLDIIKNNNPVNDDYHTWIRSVEDIKTLEETINDSDWSDYDEYNPDLSRQDIENAIDSGKITVYSSYPIKQGIFVSPSKMEAESYSSNGKVYSKEVNINDVAWIDPTQGQYAKVYDILPTKYSMQESQNNTSELENSSFYFDNKGRKLSKEQQEYFKDSAIRVSMDKGYPVIDKNGELFEVYHGTNNGEFTKFNKDYIGSSNDAGWYGKGFYFAFSESEAKTYGNKVIKAYLNIKNPFNFTDEMQTFNGKYTSDVNEDFGAFMINLDDKFHEIAENNTIKYADWDYNEDGSRDVKKMSLSQLAQEIKKVYNSPKLRIVEINDGGKTKYQYVYSDNFKETDIPQDIRKIIEENHILNKNDIDFAVREKKYYPNLTEEKINKLYDFFNETNYDFTTNTVGWLQDSKETLEKNRLSYATNVVNEKIHSYIDMHMPEVYMEYLGEDISNKLKEMGYDGVIQSSRGDEIVAFYPNQIKNVDNTNPTSNEDIRYSQSPKEWNDYLKENFPSSGTKTEMSEIKLPVRKDFESKENNETKEPEKLAEILKEKPNTIEEKDNWLKKLATIKFIDKGYYVDKLARKVKNKELSSKYDYSLLSNGIANQIIGNGRVDEKGNKVGKGLYEIFEPIENSGLLDEFSNYIYHKHNIDRMSLQNRFNEANKAIFGDSMTSEMSEKIVNEYETKYPEFESWADDIYEYNNANLEMLVKYGVLSKDSMEYYNKKYPHYVPTIREQTKTKTQMDFLLGKKASVNNPIKKAKGGNGNIIPLKDAMALRTMQTVNSALRNNFGLELLNSIETEQIRNQENIDNIVEEINSDELLAKSSDTSPATLTVFDKGEKVTFDISDEIYEALKPSNIKTFKFLNKLNNIRRGLLTEYNPTFMITNPLKDIQDGSINSKHPKLFIKNLPEAIKQIKNNGQYKQLYIANGGSYETYFNYNTGTNIAPSKLDKIAPLKKISEINELIEMAPRLAEFISSIEAGDSIETAMYNASEITTNFKRGGDITKTLDRNGVTFLNAGVQGTTKQVRNVQEARVEGIKGITRLAVRWTIAGLVPTLLMNIVWGDDDDYEELSDYVKNNYYIIGKYDNGEFIRIPKGRVVSVLQSFFQNVLNGANGKEIDLKGFADLIENNLLPSDPNESSLIAPIKQAINNETWYGGDLVPTRLQNLPNAEQYDESTDSISIWLGKQLNISPYKINYVLDQYSGAIGDYILPYLTQEAESGNDSFTGKLIAPVKDKFTVDSTLKNQNISDFYSLSEKLTKKSNSSNATDEDILKNKYINSIKSEISKLYAEKREIQSSSSLKDSDKYNQSKELQKQINELSKTALNNYKNIEITDNYAIVGNKEYYKNSNDEWTKIDTESPKYKIANLITKYNNYLKYNDEIKNIKNQYDNSNTRKNAVIKYVNSLDLTIPQKAMLIKMNYSSYNNYNNQIISYVNNQKISLDEKKEILEELGFKVRNGKVYTK